MHPLTGNYYGYLSEGIVSIKKEINSDQPIQDGSACLVKGIETTTAGSFYFLLFYSQVTRNETWLPEKRATSKRQQALMYEGLYFFIAVIL